VLHQQTPQQPWQQIAKISKHELFFYCDIGYLFHGRLKHGGQPKGGHIKIGSDTRQYDRLSKIECITVCVKVVPDLVSSQIEEKMGDCTYGAVMIAFFTTSVS
jgi:hypothetical protein